ncbi:2-oxo acid dehydrogenase subunit E2 [Acetobacterium sp.]|uniref:2-oxo acid dehydrogenase subunit E2 n=1 Tax=Acetobacterium sp. TaxID=1872094 RepID=UPI0035939028
MIENEIILPKEKLDMAAENLTNVAAVELADTIKEDVALHGEKQQAVIQEADSDMKTETAEAIVTETPAEIIERAEDPADENSLEENLEEKLTAAIEALEINLAETIKAGIKEQPSEAIRGIFEDEVIEELQGNPSEPDPRVGKVRATPAARRIAREFKVELKKATGTGPNGRIEADDVKKMVVIQPGTFDYKSKEPVVIGTSLDKIAGNPSNLFSTPVKLEEIPDKKTVSRKKLKDMNQRIEKVPNPELDFVPFVDENDKNREDKDADVVTKVSALDFVPFIDLKVEPLREEIIVKPTPMHLLHESEPENLGLKNKKSRGLPRKNQIQDKNKNEIKAAATSVATAIEAAVSEEKSIGTQSEITQIPALEERQPENIIPERSEPEVSEPEVFKPEVTETEKVEPMMSAAENMGPEATAAVTEEISEINEVQEVQEALAEIIVETVAEPLQESELAENNADNHQEKNRIRTVRPKAIRKYLVKSNVETPVISLTTEIDMTEIKDLRKKITKKIEEQARYRCTYTDFLLLATSRALVKHPLINARREDDVVVAHAHVNMGLTVESEHGFIVPVIPNAQLMNFVEIVKCRGDLLKAVKNKHLSQDQLEGSTFTITNLGMYGIREFTAIINQTNSAILSVGEVVQRVRIHQGEPVVRSVMKICLNLDQRVANGVDGAKFLQDIKADMENPSLLLF